MRALPVRRSLTHVECARSLLTGRLRLTAQRPISDDRHRWISTGSSTSGTVVKFVDERLAGRASLRARVAGAGHCTTPPAPESAGAMIDRLPPQSLEAEQSVLGAILIDRDAVIEVAEFLRPADFYRQANGRIYAAVLELFERREPIDIVTVAEALERKDELEAIGGRAYLSSLSNETPTAVHVAQYARIVERKAVLREPDRRRRPDRRDRLRGSGRDPGGHRSRRGGAVRGQPEARRRRVQPAQVAAPRRLRPARLPPRPPRRDQRRPDRVHGPRHAHDRPPEERPDRPRRPAVRRQDELRAQHRRARRGQGEARASASSASR